MPVCECWLETITDKKVPCCITYNSYYMKPFIGLYIIGHNRSTYFTYTVSWDLLALYKISKINQGSVRNNALRKLKDVQTVFQIDVVMWCVKSTLTGDRFYKFLCTTKINSHVSFTLCLFMFSSYPHPSLRCNFPFFRNNFF